MSREYRQERDARYEAAINRLLENAPEYVRAFYEHMHNGKREITTQAAYIRDVVGFLCYLQDVISNISKIETKDVPIDILAQLNLRDLNEYRQYLSKERKINNASSGKKLAALSAFFKFLALQEYIPSNPMTYFEFPTINQHRIIKLDSALSNKLLDGILRNDKYLVKTETGEAVIDIPHDVKLKKEKTVLRNYAICYLFLGSGLRVSELVGLDLNDINFRQNCVNVILKGGDENQVYFSDDVADAIRSYLNGSSVPSSLFSKYITDERLMTWCKTHTGEESLPDKIKKSFPEADNGQISDMVTITHAFRRYGRADFHPAKNCNAVFLSNRGTRLTVRMVEVMIKEMVKTYLPDYDDKELFSPHKLRATCATRILTQTGNIELASTQLNHKGIAVTAKFYAEIQKEQRKDQIKKLNVTDW